MNEFEKYIYQKRNSMHLTIRRIYNYNNCIKLNKNMDYFQKKKKKL
jgi:hypothetical protein